MPGAAPFHFLKISVNNFLIDVNFVWIFETGLATEHEHGSGLMVQSVLDICLGKHDHPVLDSGFVTVPGNPFAVAVLFHVAGVAITFVLDENLVLGRPEDGVVFQDIDAGVFYALVLGCCGQGVPVEVNRYRVTDAIIRRDECTDVAIADGSGLLGIDGGLVCPFAVAEVRLEGTVEMRAGPVGLIGIDGLAPVVGIALVPVHAVYDQATEVVVEFKICSRVFKDGLDAVDVGKLCGNLVVFGGGVVHGRAGGIVAAGNEQCGSQEEVFKVHKGTQTEDLINLCVNLIY